MAQQIALAAIAFEQQRTGHAPASVTVVLTASVSARARCSSLLGINPIIRAGTLRARVVGKRR
jgi:hypothetical protein